jgi:proteasome lid subunit RPN8/RPN11
LTEAHETQEIWLRTLCERQISKHLISGLPYEACGVLRGKATSGGIRIDTFIAMRNVAPDPLHHFILEPKDWTREYLRGNGLIGLFHSHPYSPPIPSPEDLRQLPLFAGMFGVYLIGSTGGADGEIELRGYSIHKGSDGLYTLQPAALRKA